MSIMNVAISTPGVLIEFLEVILYVGVLIAYNSTQKEDGYSNSYTS